MRRRRLAMKLSVGILLFGMLLMVGVTGWAAEPVTGIGSLLVNPSAVHRKVVKLEGVAKNVVVHAGSELGTKQSLCGAEFQLEDSSGTITVLYRSRCQVGALRATVVTPARPVLMVVPLNRSSVEVEAQVQSKDVGVIHKGQPAEIKVATFQSMHLGTIPGHVLKESDKQVLNAQVGPVSSIRVGLDRSTIQVGSTEVKLVPGMAVAVEIKTGQRRMIDHLIDPVLESAKERVRDLNALVDAVRGFLNRRNLL